MKTQIVYVLVSSEKDVFLEELWASVWSLRQFHPKVSPQSSTIGRENCAKVNVVVDDRTNEYIHRFPSLVEMFDEIVVVSTPEHYTPKERSRELKTRIREVIKGDFFYIDTDTIICKPLDGIDNCEYDMAGVPDSNAYLKDQLFVYSMVNSVRDIFGTDISDREYLINGGVFYVKDCDTTHKLFKLWNKNWTYSCFEKGNSQDQPALWQSDFEMGNIIKTLPDIYNSQVAMSLQYFADAAIVHFLHMNFISDQSYSPYLSLHIYREIKKAGMLTPEIKKQIINCKTAWQPMTIPVGRDQMLFLYTEAGKNFVQIYKEGGAASWLMLKVADWLAKLHKYTKKR